VLGDDGDEMAAVGRGGLGDAVDGERSGFGGAAGEDDLSGLGADGPATCLRARSTAACASQPKRWVRLAALPNRSVKYGSMRSSTRGSTGVVA
jgi:hypothetical protein